MKIYGSLSYRGFALIIILSLVLTVLGCAIGFDQKPIDTCDMSNTYTFSDRYTGIGSYELVCEYVEAGGDWWSTEENIENFVWRQCLSVWNSYVTVYSVSKDEIWLQKLSAQIDYMLGRRDSVLGKYDRMGYSLPSWSYTSDEEKYLPYHNPVMIGLILYPMLRFVEEVKSNNLEDYQDKADEYLTAALDALSVLDMDINEYAGYRIPIDACEDLWEERDEAGRICGYYIGHRYYDEEYFQNRNYVSTNPLPYNQSLGVAQCFPVLYRISEDGIWREKTEKSWNWFGGVLIIQKMSAGGIIRNYTIGVEPVLSLSHL